MRPSFRPTTPVRPAAFLLSLLLFHLLAPCQSPPARAQGAEGITSVHAGLETISIELGRASREVVLEELRPFEVETPVPSAPAPAAREPSLPAAWRGRAAGDPIRLPRFIGGRDRLFSRFAARDAGSGASLGLPHWPEPAPEVGDRGFALPRGRSRQGVQCIVDMDDAIALGIGQAAHNVHLGGVLDPAETDPDLSREVDGVRVGLSRPAIDRLDATLERLTRAGVENTIIFLNGIPADRQSPLLHPWTDPEAAPNHLGAFNLTSEAGYRLYRGALELLAERYSRPGAPHGLVSGFIIGNELQAHWWWHNMGRRPADDVIGDYERSVRVAHLAVAKAHAGIHVYISLDHHWTARMVDDPLRFIPGKRLLDGFAARAREGGDYPWAVAFHPYPESLWNPRSWEDRHATGAFDTPKITFKNLEVLPAYLREVIDPGREAPRRIILSEQGFHGPPGEEPEALQAAAYAWAYERIRAIPEVGAFILHRHVDHTGEGGLRLGLWTAREGTVSAPGRKKRIYPVFAAAAGPDWEAAFEFAKPILGIRDWCEVLPSPVAGDLVPIDPAGVSASSTSEGRDARGAADGVRLRVAADSTWRGAPDQGPWWWEARWKEPRRVGAILVVQGRDPELLAEAPARSVWQWSLDGAGWQDLEETRLARDRRLFRIHRLHAPVEALAIRLRVEEATGEAPVLREVELYADPRSSIPFPPWALAVATDESRNLPDARAFITLARRTEAGRDLLFQRVWLDAFDPEQVGAEPRPLCAFLTGNYRDWCERTRAPWRGTLEVLQQGALPIWASCGGAQGLAILSENGIDAPWDCPHCRDPQRPLTPIYGHIAGCRGGPCGDYSTCIHERGPTRIRKARLDPVLADLPAEFEAMESHCGEILRAPRGWVLVAEGSSAGGDGPGGGGSAAALTRIQCLRREDAPIYAAQFHIEMPGMPGASASIFGRFLEVARAWGERPRGSRLSPPPLAPPRPGVEPGR